MTQTHPITPTDELVQQWTKAARYRKDMPYPEGYEQFKQRLCTAAAQWGADQELEACCKWLPKLPPWSADDLRRHRRPKPPSLKARALHELNDVYNRDKIDDSTYDTIRRALEALPND